MKYLKFIILSLAVSFQAYAQEDSDEQVYELNPFTITPEDSTGYEATSTMSGTRIKTSLRDLGESIQVVTQEFMDDTGVTNLEALLTYTTNTESVGVYGNYSDLY